MIIFVILLIPLVFYKIRFSSFNDDYLGFEQCTAIRGIFALIIFLSHAKGYLDIGNGFGDMIFLFFLKIIGQSMVAVYFFYSGYGILHSYRCKPDYAKHFFKSRIVKILIHFDLAVILYIILNTIMGRHFKPSTIALSFVGWKSIGNSNWFICVILMLYLLTYISFLISRSGNEYSVCKMVFVLSVILWLILRKIGMSGYWYNTLMCYPAGMIYACYKPEIDKSIKNNKIYYLSGLVCALVMFICYLARGTAFVYSVFTVVFSLAVVLITMKLKINNCFLQWFGRYSFSIYILQRLPMLILKQIGITKPVIFTSISFFCTLLLACLFDRILKTADKTLLGIQK